MHRRTFLSLLGAAPIAAPLALATGAPGPIGPRGPTGLTGPVGAPSTPVYFSNCTFNFPPGPGCYSLGDIINKDDKTYICVSAGYDKTAILERK